MEHEYLNNCSSRQHTAFPNPLKADKRFEGNYQTISFT